MKKLRARLALVLSVLALAICAVIAAPVQAFAAVPFTDVESETPHYEDIVWMKDEGLSTGFEDGTFRPYADIARCDMAAFLYRLAGSPDFTPKPFDEKAFSDVDASTPHAKEIWWLARRGISTGFEDGTFRPYDPIARCGMAAFLHRIREKGFDIAAGDIPDEWAQRIDAFNEGTPLAGYGAVFAEAASAYGVDPRIAPAIARLESSSGAYCFLPHNAWGWGSVSWPDWETAIWEFTRGFSEDYGSEVTYEVAERYNQVNVDEWYALVTSCMDQI